MNFYITPASTGVAVDYAREVYGGIKKTDNISDPDLLDFGIFTFDKSQPKPLAGSYVKVVTSTYGVWFDGYITTDPELDYIGTEGVVGPRWAWKYQATDSTVLLNKHPLGIIQPFINESQGSIIKKLIDKLTPAGVTFDTSGIQDGVFMPRYVVDPNQHFTDVVKSFATAANFRYNCRNFAITYDPKDTVASTIAVDGSSRDFTPSQLTLQPTTDSIVNDCIVLGNLEPQNTIAEFFVGDGITGKFPLISSVYGADSATLLDDNFTSSSIDNTKWTVYDAANAFIQPFSGTINCLGGNNNGSYDVYLQSINLIPLEGAIRLTHGEFDFVQNSSGIIGAITVGAPNNGIAANVPFGIKVQMENSNCVMRHIINGTTGPDVAVIDFTKRYIIRTIATYDRTIRQYGQYNYLSASGNVVGLVGSGTPGVVSYQTYISEIDPMTGAVSHRYQFTSTASVPSEQTFGYYCPVILDNLFCTFTSTTISVPIQATLQHQPKGGGAWATSIIGPNEIDSYDGLAPAATIVDSNQGATTKSSLLGTRNYNPGQASLQYFSDQPVALPANTLAAINPDLVAFPNPIRVPYGSQTGQTIIYWDNAPSNQIELRIGSPTGALFASGGSRGSATTGNWVVNGTLVYMQDVSSGHPGVTVDYLTIELQQMYIPQPGDLIWLKYHSAGAAIGYARDRVSVANEAANWGDDGIRSVTRMDLTPLPRTSYECEIAASAIVQGSNYQHYQGQYQMFSGPWFSGEPVAGSVIKFQNLPNEFPTQLAAESVTNVTTDFIHARGLEVFSHTISFGPIDTQTAALSVLRATDDVFTPQDTAEIPDVIDVSALGDTSVPNVADVYLSSWDRNNYNLTINDPHGAGNYEVRYSDSGWGADDGSNLITRTSGTTFSAPRTYRGSVCWVRGYDTRNKLLYSEDLGAGAWVWNTATNPFTKSVQKDPDGNYSMITTASLTSATPAFAQLSTLPSPSGSQAAFSVSLKGTAGQKVTLQLYTANGSQNTLVSSETVTFNGRWQRFTITGTSTTSVSNMAWYPQICVTSLPNATFQVTRASLESGTLETVYCKTVSTAYGVTSRFSFGLHLGLPMIPVAPTATLGLSDELNPTLTVALPQILTDVWGIEIRASDNTTVIEHIDLKDSEYTPTFNMPYNTGRNLSYYVYTYNVLGELSDPYHMAYTIPTPTIMGMSVDDVNKRLVVACYGASSLLIAVQSPWQSGDSNTNIIASFNYAIPYTTTPTNAYYMLPDAWFLPGITFFIYPFDALGYGTQQSMNHAYSPQGVIEFDAGTVQGLGPPANPSTLSTQPGYNTGFAQQAQISALTNYLINKGLN